MGVPSAVGPGLENHACGMWKSVGPEVWILNASARRPTANSSPGQLPGRLRRPGRPFNRADDRGELFSARTTPAPSSVVSSRNSRRVPFPPSSPFVGGFVSG